MILIEACGRDSASLCDKAVYIRPGTDGALALAMMHVLWREHLEDEDFLRNQADGYEQFYRRSGKLRLNGHRTLRGSLLR